MLNREQIKYLIEKKKLMEDFIDLDVQLTPNGFDLTAGKIFEFKSAGILDFSNSERVVSGIKEIKSLKKNAKDKYGWWDLKRGIYKIRTNEKVNLPKDLIALAFPRTSLLRMGGFIQAGVWDAGFEGKSEFILTVGNPKGIKIKQNARVSQMIFIKITKTKHGYNGIYKNLYI